MYIFVPKWVPVIEHCSMARLGCRQPRFLRDQVESCEALWSCTSCTGNRYMCLFSRPASLPELV